jgi:hypothetical protein
MWTRVAWVAAFALAIAGGVLYLVVDSDAMWWIGGLMGGPLVVLVVRRADRLGEAGDRSGARFDGPWGPP